jgi:hypothetical protein
MELKYASALIIVLASLIFLAGCTGTIPGPTVTPTPQVIYVTVTVTPTAPVTPAVTFAAIKPTAPDVLVTTPAPAADPILHRYMFTYPNSQGFLGNEVVMGRELRFYPGGTLYETGGTVDYRIGYVGEVSGNTAIVKIVSEASGTWIPMGNNTYYIKILPTELGGAQLIRHFTLVPAHVNPSYPGIVYPEQIVASDGAAFTRQAID